MGDSHVIESSIGIREGKESREASQTVYLTKLRNESFGTAVLQQSKRFNVLESDEVDNQELGEVLKYCKLYESWCYEGATKEEIEVVQEVQLYLLYNIYDDSSNYCDIIYKLHLLLLVHKKDNSAYYNNL